MEMRFEYRTSENTYELKLKMKIVVMNFEMKEKM